jgi:hypothetical protein
MPRSLGSWRCCTATGGPSGRIVSLQPRARCAVPEREVIDAASVGRPARLDPEVGHRRDPLLDRDGSIASRGNNKYLSQCWRVRGMKDQPSSIGREARLDKVPAGMSPQHCFAAGCEIANHDSSRAAPPDDGRRAIGRPVAELAIANGGQTRRLCDELLPSPSPRSSS